MIVTKYFSLNEAAVTNQILAFGNMEIWYMKDGVSRDYGMGYNFVKKYNMLRPISETHTLLGRIDCKSPEEAFCALQGECWSPHGEARDFIKSLKLYHTSMSTGDIIKLGGKFYFCDMFGFKEITEWQSK